MPVQVRAGDGRWVTTGFGPHSRRDFEHLLAWLDELGARDRFEQAVFLERGVELGGVDPSTAADDPIAELVLGAGRSALIFLAEQLPAYEFFLGAQRHDFQSGIIYAPEEALEDPHFVARGFAVQVEQEHDSTTRSFTYPGAPFKMGATPMTITAPPRVGEHTDAVLDEWTAARGAERKGARS